ncbi:MAG: serine hydrolase domain-containing protein [Ekhidna sp.]
MKNKSGLFMLSLLLICSITFGQNEKLKAKIDSICNTSGYPGLVFSFIDKDGNVNAFASGYADKENNVRMTPQHKLHGGSTGKTIVPGVLMQLIAEGKVALDDKVSKYLGANDWFDQLANSQDITVRHLMQHSSGIVRYEFKEEFLNDLKKNPNKKWKPEELLAYVLGDAPPFEAGEGFTYSDTNYILLGMIIEKVTGNTFYDEARNRIIEPLGIASFSETNKKAISNMAQGYYEEGSEYALGFKSPFLVDGKAQNNMQFEWTGGGYAYENADYARLLKALYEGEVFDMELLRDDFFGYIAAEEIGGQYGLGVIQYQFPNLGEFIGHSGFFPGYNTAGFYHPETGQAFTMQINSTQGNHLRTFFRDYLTIVGMILRNN